MTHEPHFCTYGNDSSVHDTLAIVERGMARLGITGAACGPIAGLPRPKPQPPAQRDITPEMVRRMVAMRKDGMAQMEIAHRLKCSQGAVCRHLRRAGYGVKRNRRENAIHEIDVELNVREAKRR